MGGARGALLALAAAAATMKAPAAAGGEVALDEKFAQNCVACHGVNLQGIEGLGVSLVDSTFVGSKSVAELVAFLKAGRMPGDPGSVAGRPMPAFGWLPDEDLAEIAAFVKSRNGT